MPVAHKKKLDFSTIIASSIHDMKNSIGMVLASLETIVDTEGKCDCSPVKVAQLQYEAKRVNGDLVQLLTLYKYGTVGYQPNIAEVEVADFLEESILLSKPMLDYRGIEVEFDTDDQLIWYFDRNLMGGVLDNVINNAVRYTADRLFIAAVQENGYLCLRIEDNGRGFPAHMLGKNAWEDDSSLNSWGRTRLGLYFCSLIASLHTSAKREGYIELSNGGKLGGGCFAIYLP